LQVVRLLQSGLGELLLQRPELLSMLTLRLRVLSVGLQQKSGNLRVERGSL
jgi:hypothetical protein